MRRTEIFILKNNELRGASLSFNRGFSSKEEGSMNTAAFVPFFLPTAL